MSRMNISWSERSLSATLNGAAFCQLVINLHCAQSTAFVVKDLHRFEKPLQQVIACQQFSAGRLSRFMKMVTGISNLFVDYSRKTNLKP